MISIVWGGGDRAVTQPFRPGIHDGIDIDCRYERIYAARAGIVERTQTGMLGVRVGNQRDFYLHGDRFQVGVGAAVARGQLLMYSAMVQVDPRYPLTGPHLHFEVQNGFTLTGAPPSAEGAPLDPVPVLTGLFGGGATEHTHRSTTPRRVTTMATVSGLHQFCRGRLDPTTGHRGLYHRRRLGGSWSPWAIIGGAGNLGVDDLGVENIAAGVDDQGVIVVTVVGSDAESFFETTSSDNGSTWTAFTGPNGAGDGMVALSAAVVVQSATVDLNAVLAAIADLKAHPSFDPNDAATLAIVTKLENAARAAGAAA